MNKGTSVTAPIEVTIPALTTLVADELTRLAAITPNVTIPITSHGYGFRAVTFGTEIHTIIPLVSGSPMHTVWKIETLQGSQADPAALAAKMRRELTGKALQRRFQNRMGFLRDPREYDDGPSPADLVGDRDVTMSPAESSVWGCPAPACASALKEIKYPRHRAQVTTLPVAVPDRLRDASPTHQLVWWIEQAFKATEFENPFTPERGATTKLLGDQIHVSAPEISGWLGSSYWRLGDVPGIRLDIAAHTIVANLTALWLAEEWELDGDFQKQLRFAYDYAEKRIEYMGATAPSAVYVIVQN